MGYFLLTLTGELEEVQINILLVLLSRLVLPHIALLLRRLA